MKFKLTYPERIGSRRRELGMTRYDLARISRVAYSKLTDLERSKYKRVDALVLEAVAFALRIHPLELSAEYEAPAMPTITHVAVDGRQISDYLEGEGMSALELSKRAGVKHEYIYNVTRYDQQTLPADVASNVAKAMGLRGYELAPVLAIYPGPDGEEVYGDMLGDYGGSTPDEVSSLHTPSNI